MSTQTTEVVSEPQPPASPLAVNFSPELLQKALDELEKRNAKKLPMGATIAAAVAKVQGALSSVGKDRDVEVRTEKGRYAFRYATLAAIWDVIRKPCSENGLAIVQFPTVDLDGRKVSVETRIIHTSGEHIVNLCVLPCNRPDPQGIGAIITYARRYSLSALLGVTQDDENEEEILTRQRDEFGPPPQSQQRPPPKTPPPPKDPPAPPKDGEPPAEEDIAQQMRSCRTPAELSKVAAQAKGAFKGEPRDRLVKVYEECAAALKNGGVK